MEDKKKITVKLSNDPTEDYLFSSYQEEEAASLDDIPELQYKSVKTSKLKKSGKKFGGNHSSSIKSFIITALSAIVIGVGLGIFILNMFVVNEEEPTMSQPVSREQEEGDRNTTETTGSNQLELASLQAYVIQAGVFSSLEQAKISQDTIHQAGFQAILWETEEDIRLFTGAYGSEVDAKQMAEVMESAGLDLYVRSWNNESGVASLEQPVADWLGLFTDLWNASLTGMTDQMHSNWNDWVLAAPDNMPDSVMELKERVEQFLKQPNNDILDSELLVWWYLYDQL